MSIFTPDNEPYSGRQSVFQFDNMILVAMEQNQKIAPWTHGRDLTPLQRAGTELIPHGFSIALSIRELVRQGYLIERGNTVTPPHRTCSSYKLRLSKKLTPSIISFLIFVFINPPKITYNQL